MKLHVLLIFLLFAITLSTPLSDSDFDFHHDFDIDDFNDDDDNNDANPAKSLLPITDRDEDDDDDDDDDNRKGSPSSDDRGSVQGIPLTAESAGMPCFPAHGTVRLESGLVKRMDELQIGDRVAVGAVGGGGDEYSPIIMFTHKMRHVTHPFIVLQTAYKDTVISLTSGHYLLIDGRMQPAENAKLASMVQLEDGRQTQIVNTSTVVANGLYNPQTARGSIVVDGIVASCYTNAVQLHIAHALLAPFRAAFANLGFALSALETGAPFSKWLPRSCKV